MKKSKSTLIFVAVSFWPIIFYYLAALYLLIDSIRINRYLPSKHQGSSLFCIFESFIYFIIPVIAIVIGHYFFNKQRTWKQRFKSIYGVWVVIFFLIGFAIFAAVGGTSMAAVEGITGPVLERYFRYGTYSLIFVLLAHVLIIPYTYVTISILKSVNRRFSLWLDNEGAITKN